MKKIYFALAALLSGTSLFAQCTVQITGSTPATCFGACNGTATVATVGVPTYTYMWMPGGQTVQNPTDLCAGTHTVTMTDANSCVATATVTITEPSDIQVVSGVQDVTCNGACNGVAGLTVTGGTTP